MGKMRKRITQLASVVLLLAMMLSTATFAVSFTDVSGHWAETHIKRAAERELIEGYLGKYRPDDKMTRAEFVTVLWRASGKPAAAKASTFTDLTQEWYKPAIAWAQENKVIEGRGSGVFDPDGWITREEVITILHRQAGLPMDGILFWQFYAGYNGSDQISDYAKNAVYWAIYKSIYCGETSVKVHSGTPLKPTAPASRAQVAVMMTQYLDRVK